MALLHSNPKARAMPEPMNTSSHHPKVKVTTTLADPIYVAGTYVSGKLEMECRADKGLGIGIMMVELFAIQELTSRDHSATSTFLHSRRLFQGPGLPPSNAVHAHPLLGDVQLPQHYYPARRGHSIFLFRIPLPGSCPSSLNFAQGQAKVRYELRASAGVFWKNERRLVVDRASVEVVERFPMEEVLATGGNVPQAVVVGESGKLWMQGRVLGGILVAGDTACLELQVKNHSTKKNTSLTLSLTRTLYLPASSITNSQSPPPIQLSDTLTTVPFRGPEYTIPSGSEGVANLVFDVPKHARGVRGGMLDGEEGEEGSQSRITESLFEIRCKVEVKLGMGMGSKDIRLEIPIDVIHPRAMPPPNELIGTFATPNPIPSTSTGEAVPPTNHYYNPAQMQPPVPVPYVDSAHNQVWLPPPAGYAPYADMYHAHPQAAYPHFHHHQQQQPYYGTTSPPPLHALSPPPIAPHVTGLGLTLGMPYSVPMPALSPIPIHTSPAPAAPTLLNNLLVQPHLQQPAAPPPRPLSAGPVARASQLPQSMVPGLPAPEVSPVGLLPLPAGVPSSPVISVHHQPFGQSPQSPSSPSAMGYLPEQGKGERALRVSRHLKLSSRNRSVSPLSHRYPLPHLPHPTLIEGDGLHVSPQGMTTRTLPLPPGMPSVTEPLHPAQGAVTTPLLLPVADQSTAVVHSPRPQLTPKQSFNHGYHQAKSERVEELEKMAAVVVRRSGDNLSADVPKGVVERVEEEVREREKAETQGLVVGGTDPQLRRNKTLPGPPIEATIIQETEPLPSDQTPPTPTLQALAMRKRDKDKDKDKTRERLQELRTENGLDALERRLLKEVGTRKMNAPPRPDVRNVLHANLSRSPLPPLDMGDVASLSLAEPMGGGSLPIPIPLKSPEPLNDSAISSLTLAGCMADDDSDGGRTHRAESKSRRGSPRGILRDSVQNGGGLHRHMRERAEVNGRTPPKTPDWESPAEDGQDKETLKGSKASNRKKNKSAAAKGRVAAWLGRIDINAPPQEQIIPPSPSVVRAPDQMLGLPPREEGEDGPNGLPWQFDGMTSNEKEMAGDREANKEREEDIVVAPNPRSSGFVPIGTLNRNTIQFNLGPSQPLFLRDATVAEEAKRIQALWSALPSSYAPALESGLTPTQQAKAPGPKFPMLIPPLPRAQSIRTDRRVSPPSMKPMPSVPEVKKRGQEAGAVQTKPIPMSYSAVAKSARKQVGQSVVVGSSVGGGVLKPTRVQPLEAINKPLPAGRLPVFSTKPVDPEVRYDVRSARGGRGGKVTAVANLWASGTMTNQATTNTAVDDTKLDTAEASKKGNEFMQRVIEEKQKVVQNEMTAKGEPASKDTKPILKTDKKLFSVALMTPVPAGRPGGVSAVGAKHLGATKPTLPPTAPNPTVVPKTSPSRPAAGPSKSLLEPQKRPDPRPAFQDTASLKPPNVPVQKRPATAMSNPGPARGPQTLSGKTTPMLTSLSTPPSPGSKPPDLALKGGLKTMAAIVPTSTNPATAVVSSSHAVPHLSSTASLARPHPSSSATTHAPRATNVKPPAMLSASISAPSLVTPSSAKNSTQQSSSNKPSDLSFGQARLRDLIKKYQGQGT